MVMLYLLVHSVTIIVMYDYHHLYKHTIFYFLPGNINEPASEPAREIGNLSYCGQK